MCNVSVYYTWSGDVGPDRAHVSSSSVLLLCLIITIHLLRSVMSTKHSVVLLFSQVLLCVFIL